VLSLYIFDLVRRMNKGLSVARIEDNVEEAIDRFPLSTPVFFISLLWNPSSNAILDRKY
jgi:predicted DNA-binding protein (UPF0278 family)